MPKSDMYSTQTGTVFETAADTGQNPDLHLKHEDQLLVFDIQRFAVHDGRGLRTTIFLKGCPLRCAWCQNPEGLEPYRQPVWAAKDCIHCRSCAAAAKEDQLIYDTRLDRPLFLKRRPEGSGGQPQNYDKIIDACPAGSIMYDSRYWKIDDLIREVKKDRIFFGTTGGITVSGGEPFMQADNLLKLLKKAKAEGLHTCIESSFMADWNKIEPCLEYLDDIYADCKIFDESRHKQFTGLSNRRILDNLARLLSGPHGSKVTIRTPLIPGITPDADNIEKIAGFLAAHHPDVMYELLNYNTLAPAKYDLAQKEWQLDMNLQPLSADELSHLGEVIRQAGLHNTLLPEQADL